MEILEDIVLSVLNWNRVDLLQRTLCSFLRFNYQEVRKMHCMVLDNASTDNSRNILDDLVIWDKKIYLNHNSKIGGGTNILMKEFLKTGKKFLLHLENDWECLRGGFIEKSALILAHNADAGFIRLSDKEYKNYNAFTKKRVVWDAVEFEDDYFLIGDCTYTFNPCLHSRAFIEKLIPFTWEWPAQVNAQKSGMLGVQIENPKCFHHIG